MMNFLRDWFMPVWNGIVLILVGLSIVGPWSTYFVTTKEKVYMQRLPTWIGNALLDAGIVDKE